MTGRILSSMYCIGAVFLFSGCNISLENKEAENPSVLLSEKTLPENTMPETFIEKNFSAVDYKTFSLIKEQKKDDAIIIDIRTPQEIIENALPERELEIDYYAPDFLSQLNSLEKTKTYLLYCRSGSRTRDTRKKMEQMGFESVYDLKGGITSL